MQENTISMLEKEEILHIVLWMPSWIGDVVLSLPALQTLRTLYPSARITAIVKSPADRLLYDHSPLDSVIQFPKNQGDGFIKQFDYALGFRKYQFDLGIVFPNSFYSALMLMLTGARFRVGHRTDGRRLLLTHSIPVTRKEKKTSYRVNYFHKILSPLNPGPVPDCYDLIGKKKQSIALKNALFTMGVGKNDHLITVHPGTSKPERAWHAERFSVLCQKLIKQYRVKIVLLGTSDEKPLLERISKFCSSETVNIASNLNLDEVAQLFKMSRLFIGNDSGMLHLASLIGTPVVGIFGPGHPGTTGPFLDTQKQEIVTQNYPCSPCNQHFFKECKPSPHHKPYCLEDISVQSVSESVQRIIQRLGLC